MKTKKIPSVILNDQDTSPTESSLIHPYPGSMPAYLASRLVERYSCDRDFVFDPFCGSGSVIIEAAKLGRNTYGTDLLRTAVNIANTALNLPSPERIEALWLTVCEQALHRSSLFQRNPIILSTLPDTLQLLSQWFHAETFIEILAIKNEITKVTDSKERDSLLLLLAGSLISLSKRVNRGVMHWGWIADNVKPHHNDLLKTDPFYEMNRRVNRLVTFMRATGSYKLLSRVKSEAVEYDWLDKTQAEIILPKPVNLLITSPPYPYSIDYTLALRLTHYLLCDDSSEVRAQEIGARYKRKRKNRGEQYLQELSVALRRSTVQVIKGGHAVFVLHNPTEYMNIIPMGDNEWCDFLSKSMFGDWTFIEYGYRRCEQRRLINTTQQERSEFIAVFKRD
ncbi:MAG: DNA methyltransferase [Candidatus Thiodiazotropha endolucinida]